MSSRVMASRRSSSRGRSERAKARNTASRRSAPSFRLEAEEGADLREAVFRAFARSDLPLLELRRDAMTLEDIFLKLTSDDVSAPSKPAGPGGGPGTGEESAQEEVEEA